MFCEGRPVFHNVSFGHRFVSFLLGFSNPVGALGTLGGHLDDARSHVFESVGLLARS